MGYNKDQIIDLGQNKETNKNSNLYTLFGKNKDHCLLKKMLTLGPQMNLVVPYLGLI